MTSFISLLPYAFMNYHQIRNTAYKDVILTDRCPPLPLPLPLKNVQQFCLATNFSHNKSILTIYNNAYFNLSSLHNTLPVFHVSGSIRGCSCCGTSLYILNNHIILMMYFCQILTRLQRASE